jgi:outer membrane protein OmpA-like peptidoglycan-associated protein
VASSKSEQHHASEPEKPSKSNWSLIGDALTAFVVLFLLAFAWEYMRSTIKGFPKISFAPTTNDYFITMRGTGKTPPPPVAPTPVPFDDDLSILVFFDNGSHTISGADLVVTKRLARVAAACESMVRIGGFASSRMFASKDDDALHLSDARADALAQIFRSSGVAESKIQIEHWPLGAYKTMRAKARLKDTNEPSPISDKESLNRRVSIRVRLTSKSCLIE